MDFGAAEAWIDLHRGFFSLQIVVAVICGAIVGVERQLRNKAIGIRTSIMICLATQVFVRLGGELAASETVADPT